MNDVGDGALPDDGLVQPQIRIDLPPVPEDGDVQHHPLFHLKLPVLEPAELLQLRDLQLGHKPKAPHVHAQHRHLVKGRQLGQVEDGPVPAEGNQQIRPPELLGQGLDIIVAEGPLLPVPEGRAHHRLKAHLAEDTLRRPGCLHALIPVGIGAQDDLLGAHGRSPSPCSFKTWWDSSTRAFKSKGAAAPPPFCRKPRYSMFPSGPRMGEYVRPRTVSPASAAWSR